MGQLNLTGFFGAPTRVSGSWPGTPGGVPDQAPRGPGGLAISTGPLR